MAIKEKHYTPAMRNRASSILQSDKNTSKEKLAAAKILYPAIRLHLPLTIGVSSQFSCEEKQASQILAKIVNTPAYLKAVSLGGPRFNLDGTENGLITPEDQARAKTRLDDREVVERQYRSAGLITQSARRRSRKKSAEIASALFARL